MWWYSYGWWWWWVLFLIVFFLFPLGYGWGYRGWGPWYRRRGSSAARPTDVSGPTGAYDTGWGWGGVALWIILIVAIAWLIAAFAWGTW